MGQKRTYKQYTKEYKEEAVALVREQGYSVPEAAVNHVRSFLEADFFISSYRKIKRVGVDRFDFCTERPKLAVCL